MIAPAWPSDFPGGALRPPMKATTGVSGRCSAMKAAASSSSEPPISPQMTIALVCWSFLNSRKHSTKVVPIADAGRLAKACPREEVDDLVGQRPRPRDDPDASLFEDVARHDADEGLARGDETGTVRTDDAHARGGADDLQGVVDRDAFGDADGKGDAGIISFVERVGRKWRRNEYARVGRAGSIDGISNRIEDRKALRRLLSPLTGCDAADQIRAVAVHPLGMVRTLQIGR